MQLVYLSPYSPDFNPIEEAFSCIKAWIHFHQDEVLVEMGVQSWTHMEFFGKRCSIQSQWKKFGVGSMTAGTCREHNDLYFVVITRWSKFFQRARLRLLYVNAIRTPSWNNRLGSWTQKGMVHPSVVLYQRLVRVPSQLEWRMIVRGGPELTSDYILEE